MVLSLPQRKERDVRDVFLTEERVAIPRGRATLECIYLETADKGKEGYLMAAYVEGAGTTGFSLLAKVPGAPLMVLGHGSTDGAGAGEAYLPLPYLEDLPTNTEVRFQALYRDERGVLAVTAPVPYLVHPKPIQALDFDWARGGKSGLRAGTVIEDQWAEIGLTVRAENGPAILFDSSNPTGDDLDLATPGSGPLNHTPQGMLLIVPENTVDADLDGRIDDPDSASGGGTLVFEFAQPVRLYEIEMIDIDAGETTFLRGFAADQLVQDTQVPDIEGYMADNNMVCLGFAADPVTRLEVELDGSAGIAGLSFMPASVAVDFDQTMTGVPLELSAGEMLNVQLAPDLGFTMRGETWQSTTREAILLDSALPIDQDKDLRTPGYHPTNTEPQGLVMILPENVKDLDGNGIVDVPDSAAQGGILSFEFEYQVVFESATVLDVDLAESSSVDLWRRHCHDQCALYVLVATLPLARLGDNSLQTLTEVVPGIERIDFVFDGSTALAGFSFHRDEGTRTVQEAPELDIGDATAIDPGRPVRPDRPAAKESFFLARGEPLLEGGTLVVPGPVVKPVVTVEAGGAAAIDPGRPVRPAQE
jgi:hypothetical protein